MVLRTLVLLCAVLLLLAFVPKGDAPVDKLVPAIIRKTDTIPQEKVGASFSLPPADRNLSFITASLDSFNKRFPVEKVYLHTDKPYYNIGDTIWFKSYLLDRVNLTASKLSGLLYVELDNDSSEMVRRISIPIKEGVGWGQIPLSKYIFREGGYTLRAYTNWMQNFGEDYILSQRFYLGAPAEDAWLVRSNAVINRVADKDQLEVQLFLNRADQLSSAVALRRMEVKIYEGSYYLFKEKLQTDIDGGLKFSQALKDKVDGRQIRVQLTSLEKADHNKVVQIPLIINRNQNVDLQFLPEGGNLVAGLKSTVGFKAMGEDGNGVPVFGSIYDSRGREVASFATLHNGMGSFEFTPEAGEVYTASLNKPVNKKFELPKISATGAVVHVDNPEQGDSLMISLAGLNTLATDSVCYLIGTSRGVVYYAQKIALNQPVLFISKKLFPSGVARITLFKGTKPLNERAIFIDNRDRLNVSVTTNKASYSKRDSVGLEIEIKDNSGIPVQGSFSLAVTDDSQVKPDSAGNNSIAASLLINSELQGHIESPGYYINSKDKQAWMALDNLMLTQGWTGYDWKDVFGKAQPVKFEVEKYFKITGQVTNLFNKPLANVPVLISSQKPAFITSIYTDENGRYIFKNLPTIDSGSYFIQANNVKGKKISFGAISVDRFRAPGIPANIRNPILPWYVNTDSTALNFMKRTLEKASQADPKLTGRILKQVEIKGKKIIPNSKNPYGPGNADLIFNEQDIKTSATTNLYELLKQKVPGLRVLGAREVVYRSAHVTIPVLEFNGFAVDIRIDGGPLVIDVDVPPGEQDITYEKLVILPGNPGKNPVQFSRLTVDVIDALSEYKLPGLVGLEIAYSRKFTNRSGFIDTDFAKIEITTKKGMGWFRDKPHGVISYRPLPLAYPKQFYSPKYRIAPSSANEPDYRTTLHWEPNVITDHNGKARVFFYTSDIKGKYTIKISGVDVNGKIGDGSFKVITQ